CASMALKNAYAPYSRNRVGVALLAKSGKIYTGCNVENMLYGLTICAERVAICKAVSGGEQQFVALALAGDELNVQPCGLCRQFISEFGRKIELVFPVDGRLGAKKIGLYQ